MTKAVIGLYDDFNTAKTVTQELENSGFSRDDINFVATGESNVPGRSESSQDLAQELMSIGLPEKEAGNYAEGIRRGGSLVALTVTDERAQQAANIMERHVPVDMNQRMAMWRQQGWAGYDRTAQPYSEAESGQEHERYRTLEARGGEATIPVVEEELQIGKREVQSGGMRVHTHVIERPVQEQVRLREEHVDVERRPVNRPATAADQSFREETFEVTEKSEQPVVQKRARVIEEVIVRKEVGERTETVSDTVRRTDVDVENVGTERAVGQTDFQTYEADFRNRYNSNMANSGYTYAQFMPVYRYGYSLGTDSRYNNRDWSQIESEVHQMWEERNPGTWNEFKGEIRYGWEHGRKRS